MKRFLVQMAFVLLFVGMSTHLCAQSQNARVGGTVVDAGGALIPGVEVTLETIRILIICFRLLH